MENYHGDGRKMKRESVQTSFHSHQHALEFDLRAATSDIRARLAILLIEALGLKGPEHVLDIATGTGRFAQPVCGTVKKGKVVGVDEAFAMLGLAREKAQKESLPGYLQTAGIAQALPFRNEVFDCGFVAFSLHHFGRPSLMMEEAHRVLRPGGKFVVIDPVVIGAQDSMDQSLNDLINMVFRRSHGENFRFCCADDIRELFRRGKFKITRDDLHSFSFDQVGMEGVPTGRHWLEVAEGLEGKSDEMRKRFKENYFQYQKKDKGIHVKGSFSYAVICGES
jgi:ubiquinone/menaquinone biosynthesis C-methylase UbiE